MLAPWPLVFVLLLTVASHLCFFFSFLLDTLID